MIYAQRVKATYKGKEIASYPARYPWWRRLWALLLREHLPEEVLVDSTVTQFTVQGPNHEFVEKEAAYRIKACLERYQKHCPEAEIVMVEHGAIFEHHGTRPLRDYSPSKSRDYDAWAATFAD